MSPQGNTHLGLYPATINDGAVHIVLSSKTDTRLTHILFCLPHLANREVGTAQLRLQVSNTAKASSLLQHRRGGEGREERGEGKGGESGRGKGGKGKEGE